VLVRNARGVHIWQAATGEQQKALIRAKFFEAPLTIPKACFKYEDHVVDMKGIWGKDLEGPEGEKAGKWQKAILTFFVSLAHRVSEVRTVPTLRDGEVPSRGEQLKLFTFYKAMKMSESLDLLELGPIGKTPCRPRRSENGGHGRYFEGIEVLTSNRA